MTRNNLRRLLFILLGLAVVGGIAAAAFYAGYNWTGHAGHQVVITRGGMMGGYGFGGLGGADVFPGLGLVAVLVFGALIVLLVLAAASSSGAAPARTAPPAPPDPSGLAPLKDLAEMHEKGALTDEEFSAAKRKLLGL